MCDVDFDNRWRKRWFVLRHAGEIPGQYLLCYYTDRNCRKLKGQIDLDQCEQVDAGLRFENRKQKYQHMFDLKTPKRTYYLAADSEDDMNRWVDAICHICGLKTFPPPGEASVVVEEYFDTGAGGMGRGLGDSPPISPTSTVSVHPYLRYGSPGFEPPGGQDTFDPPRQLRHQTSSGFRPGNLDLRRISADGGFRSGGGPELTPPLASPGGTDGEFRPGNLDLRRISADGGFRSGGGPELTPPLASPGGTDGESVFTDDESVVSSTLGMPPNKPQVNWETFPRPSDSSLEGDLSKPPTSTVSAKRFTRTGPGVTDLPPSDPAHPLLAPPRPPKPNHLVTTPTHTCTTPGSVPCDACVGGTLSCPVSGGVLSPDGLSPQSDSEGGKTTGGGMEDAQDLTRSQPTAESKKPLCSNNSAGGPSPSSRPGNVSGEIFRYDFDTPGVNPPLTCSSAFPPLESPPVYSNLHSPSNLSTPPLVNRELKPGRKLSDSTNSNEASPVLLSAGPGPSPLQGPGGGPPNIDRKLKPAVVTTPVESPTLKLASPPAGGSFARRKQRAAPSPVPPHSLAPSHVPPHSIAPSLSHGLAPPHSYGHIGSQPRRHSTSDDDVRMMYSEDQVYICNNTKFHTVGYSRQRAAFDKIQYLDLDFLDTSAAPAPANTTSPSKLLTEGSRMSMQDSRNDLIGTTYKTIDFLKTEAFNRTRQQRQVELVELQSKQTAQPTL
ncbi:hypothetical protein M8J75_002940 [Diaphorina citri]|nr:hypothetical protein M8J75_002940 [Diaphorina citri]